MLVDATPRFAWLQTSSCAIAAVRCIVEKPNSSKQDTISNFAR